MQRLITFTAAVACALAAAPAAMAATVSKTGSTISYQAPPGEQNDLRVDVDGVNLRFSEGTTLAAGPGCTGTGVVRCPMSGVTRIVADTGDRADEVAYDGNEVKIATETTLGDGPNFFRGGGGPDTVTGGPDVDFLEESQGADTLRGGDGNDILVAGPDASDVFGEGGDDLLVSPSAGHELHGGAGFDTVFPLDEGGVKTRARATFAVSLDDVADDGFKAPFDNARSDVEAIDTQLVNERLFAGEEPTPNRFTGTDGPNLLRSGNADDVLDGRGGPDLLASAGGADRILARDGAPDTISCGAGIDVAVVDAVDSVDGCEQVDRAAPPAGPAPAPAAAAASQVVVALPRALAVPVLKLDRTRDRGAPFAFRVTGRLPLPGGVTAATACREGAVVLQVKRGTKSVRTTFAALKRDCTFSVRLRFASRKGLGDGRLSLTARFLGNEALGAAASKTTRIRLG